MVGTQHFRRMWTNMLFGITILLLGLVPHSYSEEIPAGVVSQAEIQAFTAQVAEWGIPPLKRVLGVRREVQGGKTLTQFVYESDDGKACTVTVLKGKEGEPTSEWTCDNETTAPQNTKGSEKKEEPMNNNKKEAPKKTGIFGKARGFVQSIFGHLRKKEETQNKEGEKEALKNGDPKKTGIFGKSRDFVQSIFSRLKKKEEPKTKIGEGEEEAPTNSKKETPKKPGIFDKTRSLMSSVFGR